jgi:serine/threonine protein kinase
VVHAAEWWPQGAVGHAQAVAVKLFKGHITSDGLPGCEMAATLAASQHPHLLGALGPLVGHPQGQVGLVLPRVPAHYQPLAAPPSFDSCSRDVYPTGWRLPGGPALQLAADMARAVAHLHAGGVLHGDVYGHNILRAPDGVGPALLSDFGAATPLARLPPAWQRGLQALETRAWGLLLQELLAAAEGLTPAQRDTACAWAAAATQPEPSRRPHMAQLASWAQQAGITD